MTFNLQCNPSVCLCGRIYLLFQLFSPCLLRGGQHKLRGSEFKLTGVSKRYFMVHAMVIKVTEADNKED